MKSSMSKQEIVDHFSSQDEQRKALAYEYCYHGSFPKLLNFIYGMGGNLQDAQDIIQESILVLHYKCIFKSIPSGNLIAYIIGTGKKKWYKRYSAYLKDTYSIEEEDKNNNGSLSASLKVEDNMDEIIEREKKEQDVIDLVKTLKPKERELVRLHFEEGLTWVDIADFWGKKPGAIRRRWYNLKNKLYGRLEKLGYSSSA